MRIISKMVGLIFGFENSIKSFFSFNKSILSSLNEIKDTELQKNIFDWFYEKMVLIKKKLEKNKF